jgi:predicted DCC family thiol-disulfide oxidoreductase YuxK
MIQLNEKKQIIIFDGICWLCDSVIQFIFKNDPADQFVFVASQSKYGQELLFANQMKTQASHTVILIKDQCIYTKSDAFFEILLSLKGPWFLVNIFRIIPRAIRDWVYDWISANRYNWFGRKAECSIPVHKKKD